MSDADDLYPLPPFRVRRRATLAAIVRAWPLATLFSGAAGAARITLLPLLVDEEGEELFLTGHLDVNNGHAAHLAPGAPVSFQFLGPDAYASPDLYPDPQLPGWLYVAVQGDAVVESDVAGEDLRRLLVRATEELGAADQRFVLDPADPRVDRFLPGIRGFRLRVTRIAGIAKLAQDKGPADARLAREHLVGLDGERDAELLDRLLRETLGGAD